VNQLAGLVTPPQIARLLDVSRARAHELVDRPDFPRPVGRLGRSEVWRRRDVERWAVVARAPGRGRRRQPQLSVVVEGVTFRTAEQPGVLEVDEGDGVLRRAIAWLGSPILALEAGPDGWQSAVAVTARSRGLVARRATGFWELVESEPREPRLPGSQ
jgi:predicted DNA-binding transcriptional regulator AlpA